MRYPYRRQWLLRRIKPRGLCRSDPHLAAMLAIFARLTAGEAITSKEQSTSPGTRVAGLAWLEGAAVHAAVALFACAGRALRRVAGGARRGGVVAKAVLGVSPLAGPPLRRSGPGLPAN